MTTFSEALAQGMKAHERATAARGEIDGVLAAASHELTAFLKTRVVLVIQVVDRPARDVTAREQAAGLSAPREKTTMLIAKTENGAWQGLAEVQFAEIGFPISLRWDANYQQAAKRDEFEQVLSALFASASTGEKLSKLVTQAA